MNLDWILNPITPFIAIALALAATVVCWVSTKSEVQRLRRAAAGTQQDLERKLEAVQIVIDDIGRQPKEEPAPVTSANLRPSLNLTRRAQALRMRRRGESVESIAAALSAPRNEIELLLKVHEIVEYRRSLPAPEENSTSAKAASA